ncbi:hypothetical protein C5C24_16550 [Rathayibacter sp. AY2B3]|nr:hypothetical protein C5C24_16550 [Rathayibacter sp. AY2B3]PPI18454.1 hypothetical protein C5D08_16165 [Rathayibacter sp. AY1B6]PPI20215.1 hypothetical protein C5D44_17100 [Rathayibacter sp. AY1B5]PPI28153.1 hypothetical protein C5D34_15755 [Rathayibacter sp. AY1B1]
MRTLVAFAGIGALVVAVTFAAAPFLGGALMVGFVLYLVVAATASALTTCRRSHEATESHAYAAPLPSWVVSVIAYACLDALSTGTVDVARLPGFAAMFSVWPVLHLLVVFSARRCRRGVDALGRADP